MLSKEAFSLLDGTNDCKVKMAIVRNTNDIFIQSLQGVHKQTRLTSVGRVTNVKQSVPASPAIVHNVTSKIQIQILINISTMYKKVHIILKLLCPFNTNW